MEGKIRKDNGPFPLKCLDGHLMEFHEYHGGVPWLHACQNGKCGNYTKEGVETLELDDPPRTLVRVVEIDDSTCQVVLPGFDGARQHIPLSRSQVPPDIWALFQPGKRLHARVNIGAADIEDLVFFSWEPT